MHSLFCLRLCVPTAPVLPIIRNENFGTFSFYGQHSDKLSGLPSILTTGFESYALAARDDNPATNFGSIGCVDLLQRICPHV